MNDVERVDEDVPIRQGDIVRIRSDGGGASYVVVVTADCDIAQGKSGHSISVVRLISITGYIRDYWAVRKLARHRANLLKGFIDFVHRVRLRSNSSAAHLSSSVGERWAIRSSAEQICDELGVTDMVEREKFSLRIFEPLKRALKESSDASEDDKLGLLLELRAMSSPSDTADVVLKQARSEVADNLPQDCFFISGVPGDGAMNGGIVLLREIEHVPLAQLTTSFAEFRDGDRLGLRVARLAGAFKFAFVQQFAILFSRIGLPDEREDLQDLAVEIACSTLVSDYRRDK